jgi:hypothetical protein
MGVESMLTGRDGGGSLALQTSKSQGLWLNVNSTLADMAEAHDRDTVGVICALNGIPDGLRPTLEVEDASFKDVEAVAKVLAEMATAGAVLAPDDPAIDDVRDLCGISRQPEMTPERMGMLAGLNGNAADPGADPMTGKPPQPRQSNQQLQDDKTGTKPQA